MTRSNARLIGTAAITVLLRSYLLLIVWTFAGMLFAARGLLMMIGGAIIIMSTLSFLFWGLVGVLTGSLHTLLLAVSALAAGIVGVAIAGLSSGSLLRAVQHKVAVMRAEDARQAGAQASRQVRLLPPP